MIWRIIRTCMARNDIKSLAELAQVTGINPATLMQTRRRDPTSFRLYELTQLDKVLGFTVEEWEALRA